MNTSYRLLQVTVIIPKNNKEKGLGMNTSYRFLQLLLYQRITKKKGRQPCCIYDTQKFSTLIDTNE